MRSNLVVQRSWYQDAHGFSDSGIESAELQLAISCKSSQKEVNVLCFRRLRLLVLLNTRNQFSGNIRTELETGNQVLEDPELEELVTRTELARLGTWPK